MVATQVVVVKQAPRDWSMAHSYNSEPGTLNDESASEFDPDEQQEGAHEHVNPWDPSKIRITTKTFSLREISSFITDGELDLAPDFQRAYVWRPRQRTRLIESILLGIPLPAFYFNQEPDGSFQVVDGVQRLSTTDRFMKGAHTLAKADLEYLTSLDGLTFGTLEAGMRRRFANTQIVVHVIEPQTPDEVKYDIFSRVNTLGSPLSAQEIRHAMSKARSRTFLHTLVTLPSFDRATEGLFWGRDADKQRVRVDHRMMDRELSLRFCALRRTTLDTYRQFESLDAFLLDATRRLDGKDGRAGPGFSEADLTALMSDFDASMSNVATVLGKAAFRRWPHSGKKRGPINRALFEAQSLALIDLPHGYESRTASIATRLRDLFDDQAYVSAITAGTGDPERLRVRLETTRATVEEALR